MLNEKTKIGIGILAAVLITTAVLVPVSIYTDRAIRGNSNLSLSNEPVQVWGYNDQVSSTAMAVNKYMDITFTEAGNYWGGGILDVDHGGVASGEGVLLDQGSRYHTVEDDIEILDGVNGSEQGFGYLSSTWVSGYKDSKGKGDQFSMLKLYDLQSEDGDRTNAANYVDPTGSNEDKAKYTGITSVISNETIAGDFATAKETGDLDDNDEPIYTYEDGTYTIENEAMQATLNASMKVTPNVANWLRPNFGTTNALESNDTVKDFTDWLKEKNLIDDFIVAYGLFNYMAYDSSNIEIINVAALQGTAEAGIGDFKEIYPTLEQSYTNLGGEGTLIDAIMSQQKTTSGNYAIKVDGTGTNTGIMKTEIANFQEEFRAVSGEDVSFKYDLDNGGSGEAWALPKEELPGVTTNTESSGRADAFIGTSSRASKGSEISNYGYAEDAYADEDVISTMPNEDGDNTVINYTMGIDMPVFFVNKDMTFNIMVNDTNITTITNADELGLEFGDIVEVRPTGMSDQGAKAIYELGESWFKVANDGLMLVEAV